MMTTPTLPVIFTAFANPHGDLANLNREQNGIQDALGPLEAEGKIKHLLRTDTDLTSYFDFLQRWKNQIVIFHYGGHANSEALALQNAQTFFKPLVEELYIRNPESLKLVFLNGCSTHAHVQTLFDLGIPAVIASSVEIDDNRAMQFAVRFYSNLANGDPLEEAYKSAANYVKGNSQEDRFRNLGEIQTWRSTGFEQKKAETEFPWGLYVREPGILPTQQLFKSTPPPANTWVLVAATRRRCLWTWMIFTLLATVLTLAQTLAGALDGILPTAWLWLFVHLYPGLLLLTWSIILNRYPSKAVPRAVNVAVWSIAFFYLSMTLGTILAESYATHRQGISVEEHLNRSYIWLEPFNILLLFVFWQMFIRRSSMLVASSSNIRNIALREAAYWQKKGDTFRSNCCKQIAAGNLESVFEMLAEHTGSTGNLYEKSQALQIEYVGSSQQAGHDPGENSSGNNRIALKLLHLIRQH